MRPLVALACVLSLSAVGCLSPSGDGVESDETLVSFRMAFSKDTGADQSYRVTLTVAGPDIANISRTLLVEGFETTSTVKYSLSIPSGRDRVFTIGVVDQNDEVAYQGREKTDLTPGTQSVAVSLQGYCQAKGTLYAYDADEDAQGDPIDKFESQVSDPDAWNISTDDAGNFSYDIPNGTEAEVVAMNASGRIGFVRVFGTFGGEDFPTSLCLIDPDERPGRHTIQGLIGSSPSSGDPLEVYGRFPRIPGDPLFAIVRNDDGDEWRATVTPDLNDPEHVSVTWPSVSPGIYALRVADGVSGESNAVNVTVP